MYTSCTPRKDTQENWVNSLNGPSHHLIYHFQKKAKDLGWGWDEGWGRYERLLGKAQWTRVRFLCKFKSSIRVSRDLKSSFSFHSRERERHPKKKKKMEIFLININVSCERITSIWFSEGLKCLLVLKNNQPKISLIQKAYILRWQILLAFSILFWLTVVYCVEITMG